jgi:hypothetical protein
MDEAEIASPWVGLYWKYKNVKCSPTEDYCQFKAWTGCTPDVCELIWLKYCQQFVPSRDYLCLALHWLKCMPSQDEGASAWQLSRPTYYKRLWEMLWFLYGALDEVWSLLRYCICSDNVRSKIMIMFVLGESLKELRCWLMLLNVQLTHLRLQKLKS